jgi:hypothetical protein
MLNFAKQVPAMAEQYKAELNAKLSKLEELGQAIDVAKNVLGWKATKLPATACMSPDAYKEGAFSFITQDGENSLDCSVHDFTKLNEMVKQAGMYFLDGKFGSFMHTIEKYNIPKDDFKENLKKVLKDIQK